MNDDLIARIKKIRARAQQRAAAQASAEASVLAPRPAQVVQLPLWSEAVRGVPNGFLRSALFGVVRKGRRRYLDAEIVASVDGVTVRQTGPRLDQGDLDVWEQCLHLSRRQLGVEVRFSGHSVLKAIGRGTGKSQHEWLKASLRRLMATVVEIEDGRRAYAGQLIHHWYRDETSRQHVIVMNPKIVCLYGSDGWTAIEWSQRLALRSHQLAQWLHGFYSSHARPYPIKVETLHRLCGSETTAMYHFRSELRAALALLAQACGWKCWIDDDDLVHVERQPSPSQGRHLVRKAARKAARKKGA